MAYASPTAPIRTERGAEYDAFARITRDLRRAAAEKTVGFGAFATAIHRNRELWTILAANVADDANGLPGDLRARLFYLAEFTQHQSRRVLNGDAGIDILVEINTAVMQGLRAGEAQGVERTAE